MRAASPAAFTAASAAMVCIRVSPVPPDFEIATKRVVASGSLSSSAAEGRGIEIVHEMQARARAQGADARHAVAGELRQRLAAEARSAGAENDDVGRARRAAARAASRSPSRSSCLAGSRSSGSVAVGVARAQPVERARRARQRVIERGRATPCGADRSARAVDRCDWHASDIGRDP